MSNIIHLVYSSQENQERQSEHAFEIYIGTVIAVEERNSIVYSRLLKSQDRLSNKNRNN